MELDIKKIKFFINEITESTTEIEKLMKIPEEEFWKEKRNISAIKYFLLEAIEATCNICLHLVARKLRKGVESPAECFDLLEKEKLINENLSISLRRMARFRNILVHKYWEIDDRKILKYVKENLIDFEKFIKAVEKLVK